MGILLNRVRETAARVAFGLAIVIACAHPTVHAATPAPKPDAKQASSKPDAKQASSKPDAKTLVEQARKAEAAGDRARAYYLYTQAAALAPTDPVIWGRMRDLRTFLPSARTAAGGAAALNPPPVNAPGVPLESISLRELEESRLLSGPVKLTAAKPGKQSFHSKGDVRKLWEEIAAAYNVIPIFERDLLSQPPGSPLRFDLADADYRGALHALSRATNTFATAISERVVLVAQDNVQKRNEYEQTVVRTFPIPDRTSVQEAQEVMQAIQQTLEVRRIAVDQQKRQIVMRDRLAKVELAEALLRELANPKPQVEIEMELLSTSTTVSRSLGLSLPSSSAIVDFGKVASNIAYTAPSGFTKFLGFGGGASFLGLGIGSAQLIATYTKGQSQSVLRAQTVASDGQAATLHIGDKYPIITSQFAGSVSSASGTTYSPPPTVNFEELGLVLKVTPYVHGIDEVTLELEAEFKVLGGQGFNGIPVISTRKYTSKVRLSTQEWAVVAGLVSTNDARTLSGITGLANVPLIGKVFSSNGKDTSDGDVLVLIKPRIVSMPGSERVTRRYWYGSETRPRSPL